MAEAEWGWDQLVWGSHWSVGQKLANKNPTHPCHATEWLFHERLTEIWWHRYNFILRVQNQGLSSNRMLLVLENLPRSFFCLLLSQFSLTWPSPLWLILQVSSVLWRTAAEFAPLYILFLSCILLSPSFHFRLLCVCVSLQRLSSSSM